MSSGGMGEHERWREDDMGTGGGMQRWMNAESATEDVVEKDKLSLKTYAHCDSFDALLHSIITFNYIIVLYGADTLVFVLYSMVHLNNSIIKIIIYHMLNVVTACTIKQSK